MPRVSSYVYDCTYELLEHVNVRRLGGIIALREQKRDSRGVIIVQLVMLGKMKQSRVE